MNVMMFFTPKLSLKHAKKNKTKEQHQHQNAQTLCVLSSPNVFSSLSLSLSSSSSKRVMMSQSFGDFLLTQKVTKRLIKTTKIQVCYRGVCIHIYI